MPLCSRVSIDNRTSTISTTFTTATTSAVFSIIVSSVSTLLLALPCRFSFLVDFLPVWPRKYLGLNVSSRVPLGTVKKATAVIRAARAADWSEVNCVYTGLQSST